ncbi:MBL fold metallo-hydrolase [Brevibacillus sp. NRS-1366]|uniref:MBL fold metallo-hydrolase n=1 Tax=Brevibacillus sp. NRS-1366 TaxID=3233899 RepID=UPI003D1A92F9
MQQTELIRITDKILYMLPEDETDRPILAAISGVNRTLIVDAGNSSTHAELFLKKLAKNQVTKIDLLVLTHWHWDHVFGMHRMNLPTIAHRETAKKLEKMVGLDYSDEALDQRVKEGREISFSAENIKKEFPTRRDITIVTPTVTFEQRIEVDLGGTSCLIEHVGGDHSPDSCVVFVKEEKVLFLGDCLYPDYYTGEWKYTSAKTLKLLDQLQEYDAEIFVISHRRNPLSKSEFHDEVRLFREICAISQKKKDNKRAIMEELSHSLGRELKEDQLRLIDYFIHGLEAIQQ